MTVYGIIVALARHSTVTRIEPTERDGRWDGWDAPGYQPTQAELDEPIQIPGIENATPEDLALALLRPDKGGNPS